LESIQNVRTVIQLTKENYFYEKYSQILNDYYRYDDRLNLIWKWKFILNFRKSIKYIHGIAVIVGLSDSMQFFSIAIYLYAAACLIENGTTTFENAYM